MPDPYKGIEICKDLRIKYKDVFNLKKLYELQREWLKEHEWTDMEGKGDNWEVLFLQFDEADGAKEIHYWWRVQKKPYKTPLFRFIMDIDNHIIGLKDTEVMQEGMKLKVQKGETEFKISARVEIDPEKKIRGSNIVNKFFNLYRFRWYKEELQVTQKRDLYREVNELVAITKKFLKMKNFLPDQDMHQFFPSEAYPSYTHPKKPRLA